MVASERYEKSLSLRAVSWSVRCRPPHLSDTLTVEVFESTAWTDTTLTFRISRFWLTFIIEATADWLKKSL